ncbi:extracellular solute-binding protein [bacterium]|nr:extracellular solute-binding protein [bacterium]
MSKITRYFITLLFCFALNSCGRPGEDKPDGIKEVVLWETYNNEEHKEIEIIAREFEKANPGTRINIQRVPWGGHESKLMTSMITNTAPDMARVDVAFLPRLVKSASVLELTRYGEINTEDYVKAAIDSNVWIEDGVKKIYGLPDQTTGAALFYNKKMFRESGIKSPPGTWDDFLAAAKLLTKDKNGDGRSDQFGFAMDKELWWTFPFFNTYGAKFLSDDEKRCALNSEAGIRALQFKVDLYQKHKVEAGAWQSGAIAPDTGFINEMYAMILTGPWNIKRFRDAGLDFGIALVPRGPAGTSTNVGGSNMVVLQKARHPELCFKFLKYLTSAQVQAKWASDLGQIPVNIKAAEYMDLSKYPDIEIFFQQMKTAVARPKVVSYATLANTVNPYLYAALAGKKTVKETLDIIAKKIEEEVLIEK